MRKLINTLLLDLMDAIDRSDVVGIVDAVDLELVEQDKHIAGYALDAGKAIVIVVNKWDVVKKRNKHYERI